jgi:protein-histidine pros-kinase
MSLRTVFAAALGLTLLTCFIIVSVIFFRGALHQAEADRLREARVVLAAATAARAYNSNHVTPLTANDPNSAKFHPESVPAFAAHSIMKAFSESFPEYRYSEKALNPTVVDDFAHGWQVDIIERFRKEGTLTEVSGELIENKEPIFYIAQPIRVADPECLLCHTDAKSAPRAMMELYQTNGGFGWKLGEVIGAKFVTVSTDSRPDASFRGVFWFLFALGCVLIIGLMVGLLVVNRSVTRQAQRIAAHADRLSREWPASEELAETGAQEFRIVARAVNRLHRSLAAALDELHGNPR